MVHNMKKMLTLCFFSVFAVLVFAEKKTYIDKAKGYNVIVETNYIGTNLPDEGINEYRATLYNWNKETGVSTKKVQRITREVDWGMRKALAESNVGNGQTFVIRVTPVPAEEKSTVSYVTALITVNDSKYEFWDVYETVFNLDGTPGASAATAPKAQAATPAAPTQKTDGVFYEPNLGYKGRATATKAGANLSKEAVSKLKAEMLAFAKKGGSEPVEVQRFTKEESWLLQQALKKHKLAVGDTFIVTVIPEPKQGASSFSTIAVVLTIAKADPQKKSCSYNFTAYKTEKTLKP
ncbi:MAG: hypothetical protein J5798_03105 [Spirochaetaceae bacterium]|nr:hypothetical protein [Spirochaetaceae bacterium]